MVDPEDTRRFLKAIAAQVARDIRVAALQKRKVILKTAIYTRGSARIFGDLEDSRVPAFEFDPAMIRMGAIRRVENVPVAASGAIRYRSNDGEFNFTPLIGPPGTGTNRAALNEWHAGMIGQAMFGLKDNPYVPASPSVLENGRAGVVQVRTGRQIAAPPSRGHSYELAAAEFVTNNVRDAHIGRHFEGLEGIRTNSIGDELKATDNWRTFDWNLPIAANPVVSRHSGHLFDGDTHYAIGETDAMALGDKLLRAGMDRADIAEVLERIAILQESGGIPAF